MKKLLNASFIIIWLVHFLVITGEKAFDLLPKHFELQGLDATEVGFIMSFTGLGGVVILPVFIFLIDRYKKKYIVYTAIAAHLLIPVLYFIPCSQPEFYGIPRFLQGATYSVLVITFTSIASFTIPQESRSQGLALFGLAGQMSLAFGVGVGEMVLDTFGFFYLYLFSVFVIFVSLFFIRRFFGGGVSIDNETTEEHDFKSIAALFRNPKTLPVIFWVFLFGVSYGIILAFLPKLVISKGMSYIRPFYIAFPFTVVAARVFFGKVFDLFPRNFTVGFPLVFLPLSLFIMYYSTSYIHLVGAGILFGLCHAFLYPILLAMIIDYASNALRGRVVLVFRFFYHLGIFVSAYLGGYYAAASVASLFLLAGVTSSSGLLLWLALLCKKRYRNPSV